CGGRRGETSLRPPRPAPCPLRRSPEVSRAGPGREKRARPPGRRIPPPRWCRPTCAAPPVPDRAAAWAVWLAGAGRPPRCPPPRGVAAPLHTPPPPFLRTPPDASPPPTVTQTGRSPPAQRSRRPPNRERPRPVVTATGLPRASAPAAPLPAPALTAVTP